MIKFKRTLTGIAAVVMASAMAMNMGCAKKKDDTQIYSIEKAKIGVSYKSEKNDDYNQNINLKIDPLSNHYILTGIPISVSESSAHANSHMSVVLNDGGKKVLATSISMNINLESKAIAESLALIQAEINDGDDEQIVLKGTYVGKRFKIYSLSVEGYDVNFEPSKVQTIFGDGPW